MNTKALTEHLKSNLDEGTVKEVLGGQTTFRSEIENFYNINLAYGVNVMGESRDYCKKENKEKIGTSPNTLLELIGPFTDEGTLDSDLLKYETVREQIKKQSNNNGKAIVIGFGSAVSGLGAGVSLMLGEYALAIGLGSASAGGVYLLKNYANNIQQQLWNSSENIEFSKLKKAVGPSGIDKFVGAYKTFKDII